MFLNRSRRKMQAH